MRFTIRPNDLNPDWPTEPTASDLAVALKAAKDGKERKAAPATALQMTRRRVLADARRNVGCNSDNLDWIAMVARLRSSLRIGGRYCWIDGNCPTLKGPVEVAVTFWQDDRYTYCCFESV
jgi:hypothetical protein